MQDCIINASLNNKMQYVSSENRERALYKELESSDWHQDMHCLATFCDLHEVSRLYGTKAHTGIHPYYSLKHVFICVVGWFPKLVLDSFFNLHIALLILCRLICHFDRIYIYHLFSTNIANLSCL